MPEIYGDSFGDLSRNDLAAASLRERALAESLNAAMHGLQSMKDEKYRRDVLDEQRSLSNVNLYNTERNRADVNRRYDEQNKISRGYLKLAQDQDAKGLTPVQQRAKDTKDALNHQLAMNFVQEGNPWAIDQIAGLDPDVARTFKNLAQAQNESRAVRYKQAQGVADLQNQKRAVDALIPTLEKNIKEGTHFYGNDPAMGDWERTLEYHKGRQKHLGVAASRLSKEHLALTIPDEEGNFMPSVQPPPAAPIERPMVFTPNPHDEDQYNLGRQDIAYVPPMAVPGSPAFIGRANIQSRGYADSGVPRDMPAAPMIVAPIPQMVRVRHPDGSIWRIPAQNVPAAVSRGGVVVGPR